MESFTCQRCNACCQQPGFVYLEEEDIRHLAAHFAVDMYHFTDHYCLLIDRHDLVLKKNQNETCLFLGPQGCSIYEARPKQCRDFPIHWKTERSLSYCTALKGKF